MACAVWGLQAASSGLACTALAAAAGSSALPAARGACLAVSLFAPLTASRNLNRRSLSSSSSSSCARLLSSFPNSLSCSSSSLSATTTSSSFSGPAAHPSHSSWTPSSLLRARFVHTSAALRRKESKVVKVAKVQPPPPEEWVPPAFPAEVPPAPAFTDSNGAKWNVMVAACLSRFPRITPDKTKEELEYAVFRDKMDLEKSCLSLNELKEEEERKRRAKNPNDDDDDAANFSKVREEFIPASRITPEDKSNDRRSLNRRLQHTLVLLVQGKDGWAMPTCALGVEENLRKTLERCVVRTVGPGMHTHTVANFPAGVLVLPSESEGQPGTKIFFLRSVYIAGELDLHKDYNDFVWVPLSELGEYLKDPYLKTVTPFAR